MLKVWKYQLPTDEDYYTLRMPEGALILCVQKQPGSEGVNTMWALVDPSGELTDRHFRTAGAGHPINDVIVGYIGTVQHLNGLFVTHVFEVEQ